MLKFVYIQNFELILDILDHLRPSIFSLKQPGRIAACYLEIPPISIKYKDDALSVYQTSFNKLQLSYKPCYFLVDRSILVTTKYTCHFQLTWWVKNFWILGVVQLCSIQPAQAGTLRKSTMPTLTKIWML